MYNAYIHDDITNIFSNRNKVSTWRRCWFELASAQHNAGVPMVTAKCVDELKNNIDNISMERVADIERETKHEVVAAMIEYGEHVSSDTRRIIHLGATSCDITDNADIVMYSTGLKSVREKAVALLELLTRSASRLAGAYCVARTHGQVAQMTTLGKRMAIYARSVRESIDTLSAFIPSELRGLKGAVGNATTYMKLVGNDYNAYMAMNKAFCSGLGYKPSTAPTGQTYNRAMDMDTMHALSKMAATISKIANDIRLMQSYGEVTERHGDGYIGSSAMVHKHNPIVSERVCSLARRVISGYADIATTASLQWLERSIDDSAIRKVTIPESMGYVSTMLCMLTSTMHDLLINYDVLNSTVNNNMHKMASEDMLISEIEGGCERVQAYTNVRQCVNDKNTHTVNDKAALVGIAINEIKNGIKLQWRD